MFLFYRNVNIRPATFKHRKGRQSSMVEKKRNAMPWDLLNPFTKYVPSQIYDERFEICKNCEFFSQKTTQCKQCKCFMKIKCAINHAFCPEGKWLEYKGEGLSFEERDKQE